MALELLVPYCEDVPTRATNRTKFEQYWKHYNVNIIEDYDTRARAYNEAAKASSSEFIALADIDAIIPYENMVCYGDIVYPYSHISNVYDYQPENGSYSKSEPWPAYYVYGLMVIIRREAFMQFGGENEGFKGWGWEDFERYFRALNHGLIVNRQPGVAYHMDHGRKHRKSNIDIDHNYKLMNAERTKYERQIFS